MQNAHGKERSSARSVVRLTLAVPEDRFRLVTGWLNGEYVGLHVRVQVVREARVQPRFKDDGFFATRMAGSPLPDG